MMQSAKRVLACALLVSFVIGLFAAPFLLAPTHDAVMTDLILIATIALGCALAWALHVVMEG